MTTYYVAQSVGNDRNAGTAASPWRTLQHAADNVKAGDTVYVKAGKYAPFEIDVSGRPGLHIVFSAAPGHEHDVVIDGSASKWVFGLIQARGESHLTISGFRLQNAPRDGIFVEGSSAGERDIRILDNQIVATQNAGILAGGLYMGQTIPVGDYRLFGVTIAGNEVTKTNITGRSEAISLGGGVDGFDIRDNWIHHTQQYGIDVKLGAKNGKIHGNRIHDVEKHGIYLDSGSRTVEDIKIYDNTVFDSNNGIVLARESMRLPKVPNIRDIEIFNNKVYDNRSFGIVAYKHESDVLTGDFDNVSIHHNQVAYNGRNGIQLDKIGKVADNFVVSYNTLYNNSGIELNNNIGAKVVGNTTTVSVTLSAPISADMLAAGVQVEAAAPEPTRVEGSGGLLIGNDGDNVLRGQTGDDTLVGRRGADVLIGGTGEDTFRISRPGQSTPEEPDMVRAGDGASTFEGVGFASGDRFDFRGIDANVDVDGNQAFVFGSAKRAGLSLINVNGNTLVRGNTNDDAAFELAVLVEDGAVSAADYAASDFML
jgi:Ca2+-binding RTX toxin-like protein